MCVSIDGGWLADLDRTLEQPLSLDEIAKLLVDRGKGVADVGAVRSR